MSALVKLGHSAMFARCPHCSKAGVDLRSCDVAKVSIPEPCLPHSDAAVRVTWVRKHRDPRKTWQQLVEQFQPAICTDIPVTFPPGRARPETIPAPIGSPADMTIGIVLVALCAARLAGVPQATIRSTGRLTNSDPRAGNRSARPRANRDSKR